MPRGQYDRSKIKKKKAKFLPDAVPPSKKATIKKTATLTVFAGGDSGEGYVMVRNTHKCRSVMDALSVVVEAYLMEGVSVEEIRITI